MVWADFWSSHPLGIFSTDHWGYPFDFGYSFDQVLRHTRTYC